MAEFALRTGGEDPVAAVLGPLEGPLPFERYYGAAAAFEAVEERHGRERALAVGRERRAEPDARAAVRDVVGDFARFEADAAARARRILEPLVRGAGEHPYDRAAALYVRGAHKEAIDALAVLRRDATTLVGESVLLELKCRKALGDPGFAKALARARLDLEPFPQHAALDGLGR